MSPARLRKAEEEDVVWDLASISNPSQTQGPGAERWACSCGQAAPKPLVRSCRGLPTRSFSASWLLLKI